MTHLESKSVVISKEEFQSYNSVGKAFIVLQSNMITLLKDSDCGNLRRACIAQMHNPGGAELSEQSVDKISTAENVDDLFDLLVRTPYWSWIDIRIMEMMVAAAQNSQAQTLLDNYKAAIFSKRLLDLLPNVPSKEVKEKYYAKVVTKIKKDHSEVTVADLLEFQSQLEVVIMDINKGKCILEHLEKGCIEVHWYIPINCVDKAYQTARAKRYQFSSLQLQYLKIGHYPVIQDPIDQTDMAIFAPSPSVNICEW